jgi:DNA-binding transcriptional LysR family regulator
MAVFPGGIVKPALTLQQFRSACAVVDSGFNVSRAAAVLNTTQSSVSKTIKALEDDLGAAIFQRSASRMAGLSDYGHEFIGLARGILRDAETAVARAQEDIRGTHGVFRIATTHVHARYTLPAVVRAFRAKYPEVSVHMEQGHGSDVARWVAARQVQLGITLIAPDTPAGLVTLPAMKLERCLVVPHGHELLACAKPTLRDIARYRLVCYNAEHPFGARIRALFRAEGLEPRIAISATDASVIKEYVAAGEGVAFLHRIALVPEDESRLAVIDATHVMPPTVTHLVVRSGEYLRAYMYDFMEAFAPQWTRRAVRAEVERQTAAAPHPGPRVAGSTLVGSASPEPALRVAIGAGASRRVLEGRAA